VEMCYFCRGFFIPANDKSLKIYKTWEKTET